jgi:hypothetical protein
MQVHRSIIVMLVGILLASPAGAQERLTSRLDVEIGGERLSILRDYVVSWNPRGKPHPNSRERLWVAFSIPSFEPLGFGWAKGRTWESAVREGEELRRRGEEVVELVSLPTMVGRFCGTGTRSKGDVGNSGENLRSRRWAC